jgi:steroid 5-alpha reductase family enzyme
MIELFFSLFVFFNIVFIIAVIKKDFSIIDVAWGISFFIIFLVSYMSSESIWTLRILIIGGLVGVWSLRLSGYILYRSIKKGKEDFRYAAWRKEWGARANQTAYIRVYMLQMLLALVIGTPLILLFKFPENAPFGTVLDYLGLAFWIVGFLFESIGDYQKNKFKSNKENKNKFCNIGLWQYTRHPNYFGEALLWWGICFITMNSVPFYFAAIGPLILNFLLVKVSGVAMLEESYEKRDGFTDYKKTTNRFIPWFKKGEVK